MPKNIIKLPRPKVKETEQFHMVGYLASVGYSDKYIATLTKLTPGQVRYRMTLAEIRLRDYRAGNTALSQRISKEIMQQVGSKYGKLSAGEKKQLESSLTKAIGMGKK
jgi:hypothetical protein